MTNMKWLLTLALFLATGLMLSPSAHADCQSDRSGEVVCGAGPCVRDLEGRVSCARFRFGTALRTTDGQTVCGKGQCVKTLNGDIVCSAVDGGGAAKQLDGTVKCQGGCEAGSIELCERSAAGR